MDCPANTLSPFHRGEQAVITAHIADYREHYMIGLRYDESTMGYKWADGTTISDWNFSNWGPGDPGLRLSLPFP